MLQVQMGVMNYQLGAILVPNDMSETVCEYSLVGHYLYSSLYLVICMHQAVPDWTPQSHQDSHHQRLK